MSATERPTSSPVLAPHSETFDHSEAVAHSATRPARVCIATMEINGPTRNGGIGTGYTMLAELLAEAGHEVTVLYMDQREIDRHSLRYWKKDFARRGIQLVSLPGLSCKLGGSLALSRSYQAYRWLKEQTFDVIHFHEWLGVGYYSLLAKRHGLAFENTRFCVGAHSPSRWIREANRELLGDLDDLEIDGIERRSVELADAVWCPSRYLADWIMNHGWDCEEKAFIQPYLFPKSQTRDIEPAPVNELVFFGRLEARKGLILFCDALDRLARMDNQPQRVTFLGKPTQIHNQSALSVLKARSKRWPFSMRLKTRANHAEALAYLGERGRLAVLPSLTDNSPLTLTECLSLGIPFLATNVGGIPEVIAEKDHARCLVSPVAGRLALRLAEIINDIHHPAEPAFDPAANEQFWRGYHLVPRSSPKRQTPCSASPLVSVCLVHHSRPHLLKQALDSLRRQDYSRFEVILVDDGSSDQESQDLLDSLEGEFQERGWSLVRQENRYLGAARNTAACHAEGEYLLFMDDDNIAKPHEISTFVKVAERSRADIVTCLMEMFTGDGFVNEGQPPEICWLFSAVDPMVGIGRNCFGDANALVRRSAFEAVGGFTEDFGVTHEDWEFFAKATLQGMQIEVIPEALFWYRLDPNSMIRTTSMADNYARHLRVYLDEVPEQYHELFRLAQGQAVTMARLREQIDLMTGASKSLRYQMVDAVDRVVKSIPGLRSSLRWLVKLLLKLSGKGTRSHS